MRLCVSSRLRYSTSHCCVVSPQTGSPCATCSPSHSISQLLPILEAPLMTLTPCGIRSSTMNIVLLIGVDNSVSASTVFSLFLLSLPPSRRRCFALVISDCHRKVISHSDGHSIVKVH